MAKRLRDTHKPKRRLKRTRAPYVRRRPIASETARLMTLCEAKRVTARMTYADVGRATAVDKSDVSRALRLREEPTKRTVRALVSYFEVADMRGVSLRQRELALLIEMEAALTKAADKIGKLVKLREKKK